MNVVLWVVAGLLAVMFLIAGLPKILQSKQSLFDRGMIYVEDFSATSVKLIGVAEVLAAVGLIVPPLVGVASVLAPIAAVGLVIVMAGAAVEHLRLHAKGLPLVTVLGLLAAFFAVGRFWIEPF